MPLTKKQLKDIRRYIELNYKEPKVASGLFHADAARKNEAYAMPMEYTDAALINELKLNEFFALNSA